MSSPLNPIPGTPWAGLSPLMLASLGESLAQRALALQRTAGMPEGAVPQLRALEQLGLELQSLVHALGGASRSAAEPVPLRAAAEAARRQWLAELARRGLTLRVSGAELSQELEPARLQHALDLLIAHGLAAGVDLQLAVAADDAQGAILSLGGAGAGPDPAELHAQLLQWLARAQQWPLRRDADAQGWRLSLCLAATPNALAIDELPTLPRRHWTREDRVLVIEPDERTRVQAAQLIGRAGLRGDCVATLAQAEAALRDGDPRTVVTGIPLDAPEAQALFGALRQRLPGLRWVELVDQPHVFSAGSAEGGWPARISRGDLAHTLLAALAD
ncbi:hypothetical protein HNQ51_001894 [Inhella inkyongensis]|uniref:Uncharacterized protein n=1 Tax=Inhella inkyongensis TaxID=392593 RepID=A0A840S811_9BURK|nr:hypothetical protein [Inhella inkyongensis]MBB5204580.1 hypothetical protein [Inhella inkyongensis]